MWSFRSKTKLPALSKQGNCFFFHLIAHLFYCAKVLWRDPREGTATWRHLTQLPAKSFNQCVAVMDGFLYVAGGEDQNDARNQAKHAVGTLSRYVLINNLVICRFYQSV